MRSLLAGPIDIVSADPLETTVLSVAAATGAWVDGLGFGFIQGNTERGGQMYIAQLDGRAVRNHTLGEPTWANFLSWGYEDKPIIAVEGFPNGWWRRVASLPNLAYTEEAHTAPVTHSSFFMPDRAFYMSNSALVAVRKELTDPEPPSTECVLTGWAGSGHGQIVYAGQVDGKHLVWVFSPYNGILTKYNATDQAEVLNARSSFGSGFVSAAYSRAHDIFIVARNDTGRTPHVGQLYVYANEAAADHFANVSFTPGARRGGRSVLKAQLLGSDNEPCGSRNVQFEVSAGSVDPAVVTTDALGWAETHYYASTDAPAGTPSVTATLEE